MDEKNKLNTLSYLEKGKSVELITLSAQSLDKEKRSVDALFYTGAVITRMDRDTWDWIDLVFDVNGAQHGDSIPVLDSHMRNTTDNILGSARNIHVTDAGLVGTISFANDGGTASRTWSKVEQGHIDSVSIGAEITGFTDIQPGQSLDVNGKSYTAGARLMRVITAWSLLEISIVAIGADAKARTLAHEDAPKHMEKSKSMDEEKVEASAAPAIVPEKQTEQVDLKSIETKATNLEMERITSILDLSKKHELPDAVRDQAISEKWELSRVKDTCLQHELAKREKPIPAGVTVTHGVTAENLTGDALSAALMQTYGVKPTDENLSKEKRWMSDEERNKWAQAAEIGRKFIGMPAVKLCEFALQRAGITPPYNKQECIALALSTGSLTNILSSAINKQLMDSYMDAPDTTLGWCMEEDVADYKLNTRVKLDIASGLTKRSEGGEAENAKIADSKETFSIANYARQFTVDEIALVNDDLSAIMRYPVEMGKAAARLRPDLVYATLIANANMGDGVALFDASTHANYGTTGTALASATLQAGIQAMMNQYITKGKQKVPLNIAPAYLIVPPALLFTAKNLLFAAERPAQTDGNLNVLLDMGIAIRADGRVSTVGSVNPDTGAAYVGTATNWFLVADPSQNPTMTVAYLAGTGRRPRLRSTVLTNGKFGINWDIQHDIGCKALDWRSFYKATGAA